MTVPPATSSTTKIVMLSALLPVIGTGTEPASDATVPLKPSVVQALPLVHEMPSSVLLVGDVWDVQVVPLFVVVLIRPESPMTQQVLVLAQATP